MASTRPTEKQKAKLCNSEMFRSNSADLTVNPSFQNDVSYDGDGNLHFDGRTKVGKEINRIMKSRNRSSGSQSETVDFERPVRVESGEPSYGYGGDENPYADWEAEYIARQEEERRYSGHSSGSSWSTQDYIDYYGGWQDNW